MTRPFPGDRHDLVNVADLRAGDTVLHKGVERTICAKDLGKGFMGATLWGDSYCLGTLPVTQIVYGAQIQRQWATK